MFLLVFLTAARNAVVVLIAAVIGYTLSIQPWFSNQITLIQYNESIMPDFEVPDLSIETCQVCVYMYSSTVMHCDVRWVDGAGEETMIKYILSHSRECNMARYCMSV